MKMTDRELEQRVRGLRYRSSNETREKVLTATLRAVRRMDSNIPIWRWIMAKPLYKFALAVLSIALVSIGIHTMGGSLDGTAVAWADVMKDFEQQLQTNDYIHLVITDRGVGTNLDDVIGTEEIWAQRPFNMRTEQHYQVNKSSPNTTYVSSTSIQSEEGQWVLNHSRKTWGFEDADLINIKHGITFRELMAKHIDSWLHAKYYAVHNWQEGTYDIPNGEMVAHEKLNGEETTIYRFPEHKGVWHKCWLRNSDDRLLRMEVYQVPETTPRKIYEILSYESVPETDVFVPSIPDDYSNGQWLGYEDQPKLINANVVAIVEEPNSARFYRLNMAAGQTREEAITEAINRDGPALEIRVEQPDSMRIIASQPEGPEVQKPASIRSLGFGTVGTRRYGVLVEDEATPKNSRIVIMPKSEYAGQGSILFETVNYRTDYSYCKAAFDADGDGQMDAWCQVPSDEVVSGWREAFTRD